MAKAKKTNARPLRKAAPAKAQSPSSDKGVPFWSLENLLLDSNNARFGSVVGKLQEQTDILDHIVDTFGVDDVLSSLAVNGYFEAEPLVCRKSGAKAVVVEGNRRLAACLILAGDLRAAHQRSKAATFQKLWAQNGKPQIDPVPVILYGANEDKGAILSYLGVRHIAASQPWDSYAKARWVAQVVETNELKLRDVAEMIGDQHRTIHRMLLGYYFIQQVIEAGVFRPEDSLRRGRGSVTEYPFSWVYTILGYSTARTYLGLTDDTADPKPKPVSKPKLNNAATLVRAMFGDGSKARNAAIEDSRDLGELASAFSDPVKVRYLEQGKSLQEILKITQPIDLRLSEALTQIRDTLRELVGSLSEATIDPNIAKSMMPLAQSNHKLSKAVIDRLTEAVA